MPGATHTWMHRGSGVRFFPGLSEIGQEDGVKYDIFLYMFLVCIYLNML